VTASNAELEQFTLQVARSEASLEQIAAWLKRHSTTVS
jgi:prophage maintenance system killer protein